MQYTADKQDSFMNDIDCICWYICSQYEGLSNLCRDAGTVYGGTVAAATPGRSPYRDAGTEWPISDGELCLSDNINN